MGFYMGAYYCSSLKNGDCHTKMIGVFKKWSEKNVALVPKNSVIIMDNVPYHSVMAERIPNSAWRKADTVAWLNLKNIRLEESCVKTELLEIVKQNEHKFKKFVVNDMLKNRDKSFYFSIKETFRPFTIRHPR